MKKLNWNKVLGYVTLLLAIALPIWAFIDSATFGLLRILFWDIFLIPWSIHLIRKEKEKEIKL